MLRVVFEYLNRWLIESPYPYDAATQRKSRLLSALLLVMILVFISLDTVYVMTIPGYAVPWYGYLFLFTAYTLNRLSYYTISAYLVMGMFPVVVFTSILSGDATSATGTLSYLVLGLIVGSILLSLNDLLVLSIINIVGTLLLPRMASSVFPEVSTIVGPLAILMIGTILIVVAMQHRDNLEADRQILLRQSEERYRMLFEEAPDGILIISADNHILMANTALYQMTGYSREDVIGHDPVEFVAPDDLARRPPRPFSEIQVPGAMKRERVLVCKDQSRLVVVISSAYMPDGQLQYTIQDITERKKMEDALRASEEKFAKSFQSSPDAVTISSIATGKFLDVNDGFCQMSGYTREEALNRSAEELNIWDNPHHRKLMVETLEHEGRVRDFETVLRRKSGEPLNCLLSVEIIEIGNEKCMVVITRDVTEQKQIELEREGLIKELETKNAELEQFTYMVSHDLKAPIITIKGFLGFLSEDVLSGNTQRLEIDIRRIGEAADKMHKLLNDLLELSRVGRLMNDPEPVDIHDLILEVERILQGRLEQHTSKILVQAPLPFVYGDRQRLFEVFQNLLDNALKFMGNQPNPLIEVGQDGESQDGFVTFYVRDNGIGIAPQFHERIFGLFNRLNPKVEGTGVGLALVKRIIEFHGGRVWVESEPAQGTVFFLTLPQA